MKIRKKVTKLTDGRKVFDVNIIPNGGSIHLPKVIITCETESDRDHFLNGLERLLQDYTVEFPEIEKE